MSSYNFTTYTTQEVAEILRVCEMTIRRYVKNGKLKKVDTDGAIRISAKALDEFINGRAEENEVV